MQTNKVQILTVTLLSLFLSKQCLQFTSQNCWWELMSQAQWLSAKSRRISLVVPLTLGVTWLLDTGESDIFSYYTYYDLSFLYWSKNVSKNQSHPNELKMSKTCKQHAYVQIQLPNWRYTPDFKMNYPKLGVVAPICNPRTWKAQVRQSRVQG